MGEKKSCSNCKYFNLWEEWCDLHADDEVDKADCPDWKYWKEEEE